MYDLKCQKSQLSAISVHKYNKSFFQLIWPLYRFITTVRVEISENSYLRAFSGQVSQIVFVAFFYGLRLITTVWPEKSENSYLRDFSAQV